jgi:hydroxymethylglutaryl-CoA lyase
MGVRDVQVVEVGPRDGLQNEAVLLPTEAKVELIRRALAAGVRRIEATSFVHPKLVPQMADAEAVMQAVRRPGFLPDAIDSGGVGSDGVRYAGLVLNGRGLRRAIDAGVDEVNVVIVASETFSLRNQGVGVAEMLDTAEDIAVQAKAARIGLSAVIATAFGCPFEGEVAPDAVFAIADRCRRAGYPEIALADTIGVGAPRQVRDLVAGLRAPGTGNIRLRAHFHNTRNTGYANALAAVESGIEVLDASIGGIGGCPFAPNATGNIATEDLQYMLERSGYRTGLSLAALAEAGTWIAAQLGKQAPALLGRTGGFPTPNR